ncbi:hypothetical protein L9F63_000143, partial [Diploptera punctata]
NQSRKSLQIEITSCRTISSYGDEKEKGIATPSTLITIFLTPASVKIQLFLLKTRFPFAEAKILRPILRLSISIFLILLPISLSPNTATPYHTVSITLFLLIPQNQTQNPSPISILSPSIPFLTPSLLVLVRFICDVARRSVSLMAWSPAARTHWTEIKYIILLSILLIVT